MANATQASVDAFLSKIATATSMRLCSGGTAPTDRSEAVAATLANETVGSGDFGAIAGITGGRAMDGPDMPDVAISTSSSDARWLTLDDGTDLLHVIPLQGAPVTVTTGTTRDLTYGQVSMLFEGAVV